MSNPADNPANARSSSQISRSHGDRHASAPRFSPAAKWIVAIVGLLGANFAAMVLLIAKANHGSSRVVASYADPAHRYESSLEHAARDRALGWSFAVVIEDGLTTLTATDASGSPLVGARVDITGNIRSSGEAIAGALREREPGQYVGHLAPTAHVTVDTEVQPVMDRPRIDEANGNGTDVQTATDRARTAEANGNGIDVQAATDRARSPKARTPSGKAAEQWIDFSVAIERGNSRFAGEVAVLAQ